MVEILTERCLLQLLFFTCDEVLDVAPNHPILRPGVIVSIGLEKNTKLSSVFFRFAQFCNEASAEKIELNDLEFFHCQLLNGNDTMEASALMKNDKIHVRRVRTAEREAEAERKRLQRDADRTYFQQLRHLMPDLGGSKTSDVVLDCRGKLVDESGRNQQLLCTTVRAHSAILSKRCKWIAAIIQQAKIEAAQKSILEQSRSTTPDGGRVGQEFLDVNARRIESDSKMADEVEEDDEIEVLAYPFDSCKRIASGAAEIENDEDEEQASLIPRVEEPCRSGSPILCAQPQSRSAKDLLWVTLQDHSPEAIKLLLEYCYTNRVIPLGQEAFVQSCRTKPHKHQGPIPPYQNSASGSRRWPNNGHPIVSFPVALAGIALAEEAGMHRLSLMCEVAASQLLSLTNVVEALSMCTNQKFLTGNSLPRLRKSAMEIVFKSGSRGVIELGRSPAFRRALEERASVIVPTLLEGTMEAVTLHEKARGLKGDRSALTVSCFDDLDRDDCYKRERERRKRRMERWEQDPHRQEDQDYEENFDDLYDPLANGWAAETAKRSLKRMSHHLSSIANRRDIFANRATFAFPTAHRRSTNRRRGGSS